MLCKGPNNNEQAACPYIPKLVGRHGGLPLRRVQYYRPFKPFLSPLRSESVSFVAERTPLSFPAAL